MIRRSLLVLDLEVAVANEDRRRESEGPSARCTRLGGAAADVGQAARDVVQRAGAANRRAPACWMGSPGPARSGSKRSAGAPSHVTFVERDPRAIALIEANLARCGVSDRYAIIRARFAGTERPAVAGPFDVIFLDPPYGAGELLGAIDAAAPLVGERTLLVIEHARRDAAPESTGMLGADTAVDVGRQRAGVLQAGGASEGAEEPRMENVVAIYPGSFDPLTNGHVDIIHRGARLFDRIIIAVLINLEKAPLFTVPERVEIAREVFAGNANVEVDTFDGLLVDYARSAARRRHRARAARRLGLRVRDADGADEPPARTRRRNRVHDAGRAVHLRQLAAGEGSRRARRIGARTGARRAWRSGCATRSSRAKP